MECERMYVRDEENRRIGDRGRRRGERRTSKISFSNFFLTSDQQFTIVEEERRERECERRVERDEKKREEREKLGEKQEGGEREGGEKGDGGGQKN
jgi:hypothetical protein